ncbi:MAG: polysaccharide biosynthesis protein [Endomicrobia bacterium]|nr:polysaccharide biosynthesis protein [Endomicrobiia bacterium]MCL2798776.1 polysaccharide biosynthesis protein [Endomicrobiia bacterium]
MKTTHKRIAVNTIMLYVRTLVIIFINLYISRMLLALLGMENFGIVSVITSAVVIITFLNGSLSGAASRFLTYEIGLGNPDKLKSVFSAVLTVHLAAAAIFLLLAQTAGLWFINNKLLIPAQSLFAANILYQATVFATLFSILRIPYEALIIAHEKMNIFSYFSIFNVVLKFILVAALFLFKDYNLIILYGLVLFVISFATMILYVIYTLRHNVEARAKPAFNTVFLKPLLGFSSNTLYSESMSVFKSQGINVLQNMFFGPVLSAATGIANQVFFAVAGLSDNFLLASRPQIVKNYARGDYKEMLLLINNGAKIAFILVLMITIPLFLEIDFILTLWLKEAPPYTALFCKMLLAANLISVTYRTLFLAIQATGKLFAVSLLLGTVYFLIIPISWLMLKAGAAPAIPFIVNLSATLLLFAVLCAFAGKYIKDFRVTAFLKDIVLKGAIVLLLSVLPSLALMHYLEQGWIRFICILFFSTMCAALSSYFVALNGSERQLITDKIKSFLKRGFAI